LKRKVVLKKVVVLFGTVFFNLLHWNIEMRQIECEDKTIDAQKNPVWIPPL
jgi:hypothetical protein